MNFFIENLGPYVTFDALHLGQQPQHIGGRVLRFWEVRNENNSEDFLGISFILLDEKNSAIHFFIPQPLAPDYFGTLREGIVFQLGEFEVTGCTRHHKITDHPFVIKFTNHTSFVKVENTWLKIEKDKFRVHSFHHLLALANTNLALPDVVGEISLVEGCNLKNPTSTQRIHLRLMLQPDVTVSLSLWAETASRFRAMLYGHTLIHTDIKSIVLVTAVNPTLEDGTLYLDSTFSTRFFFDKNIRPITEFSKRFGVESTQSFPIADITKNIHKMETLSIADLCEFVTKRVEQDADFICQATVVDVLSTYGWNQMSCTTCIGKLEAYQNTLLCSNCHQENFYRDDRFYVALAVLDGSDIATFLVSNDDLMDLLCPASYEGLRKKVNEEIYPDMSAYLEDIIGNHYIFQIKVTTHNYSINNRSFTVARITSNANHAQPTFSPVRTNHTAVTHAPNYTINRSAPGPSFTIPSVGVEINKRRCT